MKPRHIFLGLAAAILLWGGYRAYRAHANLVTLRVQSMDVHRVISKLEWQTWERIIVNKSVSGLVTLDVKDVPLDEVLNIIGLQTDSRWTRLFPLYTTSKAAVDFKKVVRGDIPIAGSGWMNLQKSPFWQRNGFGGFGNTVRAANNLVSAQILNKDLDFTALALSRFAQAQVVPEDSASGLIYLKLAQVPFEKAVAKVAKQIHRKWDEVYALQSVHSQAVVRVKTADTNQPVEVTQKVETPQKPPEEKMEAFLATMTPEERQKVQDQIAAEQQLQSLPPEERQQKMQEMASQFSPNAKRSPEDAEQRIQNRLKDGTVEQRIAHDRQQLGKPDRVPKP